MGVLIGCVLIGCVDKVGVLRGYVDRIRQKTVRGCV